MGNRIRGETPSLANARLAQEVLIVAVKFGSTVNGENYPAIQ